MKLVRVRNVPGPGDRAVTTVGAGVAVVAGVARVVASTAARNVAFLNALI
jgi:hypothetical protein